MPLSLNLALDLLHHRWMSHRHRWVPVNSLCTSDRSSQTCGCFQKIGGLYLQIIHLFIGFSIIFTIHFGGKPPYFWKHPCDFFPILGLCKRGPLKTLENPFYQFLRLSPSTLTCVVVATFLHAVVCLTENHHRLECWIFEVQHAFCVAHSVAFTLAAKKWFRWRIKWAEAKKRLSSQNNFYFETRHQTGWRAAQSHEIIQSVIAPNPEHCNWLESSLTISMNRHT